MHVCNPDWKTILAAQGVFLCPESIGRFFSLEKEVTCLNVLLNVHYTISVSVYSF